MSQVESWVEHETSIMLQLPTKQLQNFYSAVSLTG